MDIKIIVIGSILCYYGNKSVDFTWLNEKLGKSFTEVSVKWGITVQIGGKCVFMYLLYQN